MLSPVALRQQWNFLTTPPMGGTDNMAYDLNTLWDLQNRNAKPTVRIFRFREKTVSYGRLQKLESLRNLIPAGWATVQRPTGGGMVYHGNDLCLSLTWKKGESALPLLPRDQYRWIHNVILDSLRTSLPLRMAACCDVASSQQPFETRACFNNPTSFDLLSGENKVVGGALFCQHTAVLYQGSIQLPLSPRAADSLLSAFESRLS